MLIKEKRIMANRSILRVCSLGNDSTIRFAADELVKYLRRMTGGTAIHVRQDSYKEEEETIWLGTIDDFPFLPKIDVPDAKFDDAITVNIKDRRGLIAGINSRSVLLGVYQYLNRLGCYWIRPGLDGEVIPSLRDPLAMEISFTEIPTYRHRGFCIEGAVSYEHIMDFIDWAPKNGFNSYFFEYLDGFLFFNNWYSGKRIPDIEGGPLNPERPREFVANLTEEIKKRGLLLHQVGHGWTCIPLGIPQELWDERIDIDLGEKTRFLAEYRGKRDLYLKIPRRTNLCYSLPEVRTMMAVEVANYAETHPEVDFIHVWLADGANHFCECENCRDYVPSDLYIMILNEIDELLTERQLSTKIVFLNYLDLLYTPEKERFNNPDRFTMMFAPLYRSSFQEFDLDERFKEIPEFSLNNLKFAPGQNLNFLYAWQKIFAGDSFTYDYRFMWDHYHDPGYSELARVLDRDFELHADLKINGTISDQTQRVFFPTGFPLFLLGKKLWNRETSYGEVADEYYSAAFGANGQVVREYLETLSELFDPFSLGGEYTETRGKSQLIPEAAVRFKRVPEIINEFRPYIARNLEIRDECLNMSWFYLDIHAEITTKLARAFASLAAGEKEKAAAEWNDLLEFVTGLEYKLNRVFDTFLFIAALAKKFK